MTEAYDGPHVVGIDLHRRRGVLVRMTGDGRKLETARITNSPAELRRQIARAGKSPRVVPEGNVRAVLGSGHASRAGVKVVRPARRSTLTPALRRHARNPDRNRNKNGHTTP